MAHLAVLGRRARSAPRVVLGLPIETLQRRADARRHDRRAIRGSVAVALFAVAIFAAAVGLGRRESSGTSPVDPSIPVTTALPPTPAPPDAER